MKCFCRSNFFGCARKSMSEFHEVKKHWWRSPREMRPWILLSVSRDLSYSVRLCQGGATVDAEAHLTCVRMTSDEYC